MTMKWERYLVCLVLVSLVGGCSPDEPPSGQVETPKASRESVGVEPAPEVSKPQGTEKQISGNASQNNAAPRVTSVTIEPFPAFPGTPLAAAAESEDADGDIVVLEYEWRRNDEVLGGETQSELDTSELKKGDLVTVVVTPFDGTADGEPKESMPVILHNRPPEISSIPSVAIEDGRYTYQVVAEDPDGDELVFSLEEAPPGMTVGAEDGLVSWEVPSGTEGKFNIRIIVSDGDAKAYQAFSMNVGP